MLDPGLRTRHSLPMWLAAALAMLSAVPARAGNPDRTDAPPVRDLGVPVKSVNWVRLFAGRDRGHHACIYVTMGQTANPLFVLQVNPETGATRQFVADVEGANFPTATLLSRTGKLYVGAAYAGHLLCFDPDKDALQDLGAIHPGAATFPCRMDEDEQGRIWIGSYGTADLTCYDPGHGQFTHYGRMDEVDMYNYPLVNRDGKIACLIRMTRPHVVVLDPDTRNKVVVGPVATKGKETLDMRRRNDGRLYIESSLGNFRIDATEAIPVDSVPPLPTAPALPDGSEFFFADAADQINRQLVIRGPDGRQRTFRLEYQASGNDIFCLHKGPDGCVYGSSYLPLHLIRFDPRGQTLTDLGRCSNASGEAYSMANLDGKMYISSYSGSRLSVYDPSRPYRFGTRPDDNPRDLGRIDDISCRPRSTLAGPLGRVYLASVPDYGRWGGALSYFDPKTQTKKAYHRIVGDACCYTLAWLRDQELLAVGTNIGGGSGTRPKVKQAQLILWDYQAEKIVWQGTLDRPVSVFSALVVGPDGRLYGTARGTRGDRLLVFDPSSRKFIDQIALPESRPLDLGLQNGPDGKIYGFTSSCIYQLDPATRRIKVILRRPGEFNVPGPIVGRDLYFATGSHLRAVRLF